VYGGDELVVFEAVQGLADFVLVELHDGLAVVLLIAGVDQRVEGERVVLGRGRFFFDECAEDTSFHGVEDDGHDQPRTILGESMPRGAVRAATREWRSVLRGAVVVILMRRRFWRGARVVLS
jgi:hypothetical protein